MQTLIENTVFLCELEVHLFFLAHNRRNVLYWLKTRSRRGIAQWSSVDRNAGLCSPPGRVTCTDPWPASAWMAPSGGKMFVIVNVSSQYQYDIQFMRLKIFFIHFYACLMWPSCHCATLKYLYTNFRSHRVYLLNCTFWRRWPLFLVLFSKSTLQCTCVF